MGYIKNWKTVDNINTYSNFSILSCLCNFIMKYVHLP